MRGKLQAYVSPWQSRGPAMGSCHRRARMEHRALSFSKGSRILINAPTLSWERGRPRPLLGSLISINAATLGRLFRARLCVVTGCPERCSFCVVGSSEKIHPTAVIDPSAVLADDVEVGPYAVIEADVSIAAGCRIEAHAMVRRFSVLDEAVSIDSFAVIGGLPQDLSFDPQTESRARIGKSTTIREGVTVHRSTQAGGVTTVGANCLLMANAHVAHDCRVDDNAILANNVMLAGHVHVGDSSFLGGGCGVHQFVTIGALAMISGNASVAYDVPSYVTVAERSTVTGLNLVGLKRKLSREAISDLRACYKTVYLQPGNPAKLAQAVAAATPEGAAFLNCL